MEQEELHHNNVPTQRHHEDMMQVLSSEASYTIIIQQISEEYCMWIWKL